jgi:ribosomal protein S18 acetylase RimI-like enzyme
MAVLPTNLARMLEIASARAADGLCLAMTPGLSSHPQSAMRRDILQDNQTAQLQVAPFQMGDQIHIRRILESVGWDEHYILAFEQAAVHFAGDDHSAVFMARLQATTVGFVFVEFRAWNRLAQIQGLAVDSAFHRHGAASGLMAQAEGFARANGARGVYVDTPTTNDRGRRFYEAIGYQVGYIMPRYYEEALDGVTYQKFFDEK